MTRSHVALLLLALALGRCSYEAGLRKGAEDGWWQCMAEHGEVE